MDIGRERAEITVVDAADIGIKVCIVKVVFIVHLQKYLHTQIMGCLDEIFAFFYGEDSGNEQDGGGTALTCLEQLTMKFL